MRNRKWWCFVIAVISITLLSWFNKDGSSSIVALTLGLFAANVVQKHDGFTGNQND